MLICISTLLLEQPPTPNEPVFADAFTFTLNINSGIGGNWNGFNIRQRIPAASLALSGSIVRVTLEAATNVPPNFTNGFTLDGAYIGHTALSGDAYDFDGGQVPLTFNGGSLGVTTAVGATVTSDDVEFNLDNTKNLLIAVHFSAASSIRAGVAGGDIDMWSKLAANETATTNVTGYSLNADVCYMVNRIEVAD